MKILSENISKFSLRGCYPTQIGIYHGLRERLFGDNKFSSHLGIAPGVVYYTKDGLAKELEVKLYDLPFLTNRSEKKAKDHLALLIAENDKEEPALNELNLKYGRFYEKNYKNYRGHLLTDTEFVVNSNSTQIYGDEFVSNKGAELLLFSRNFLPVPGFTIITSKAYDPKGHNMSKHLSSAIENLSSITNLELGSSKKPLLFAMREAMPMYLPGFMPTYLNVGTTEASLPYLKQKYGPDASMKIYLNILANIYNLLEPEKSKKLSSAAKAFSIHADPSRSIDMLSDKIRKIKPGYIEDPFEQSMFLMSKAYEYFHKHRSFATNFMRDKHHRPSLILQKMVYPVKNENSYAGVAHSRELDYGIGSNIEVVRGQFGEEIMTGKAQTIKKTFTDKNEIKDEFPGLYHILPVLPHLEKELKSPVTIEIGTEEGLLAMLQLNKSALSGPASIISHIDLFNKGVISEVDVINGIKTYHIRQLESPRIKSFDRIKKFSDGLSVLPTTAAVGIACFDINRALKYKEEGHNVILIMDDIPTEDLHKAEKLDGAILISDLAIHAAGLCRDMGIPMLMGLGKYGNKIRKDKLINSSGEEINEGSSVTISSKMHTLFKGKAKLEPSTLTKLLKGKPVKFSDKNDEEMKMKIFEAYKQFLNIHKKHDYLKIKDADKFNMYLLGIKAENSKKSEIANNWFNNDEASFITELAGCDTNGHVIFRSIFSFLTMENQIKLLKLAFKKMKEMNVFGVNFGTFVLGRMFYHKNMPEEFWKAFTREEMKIIGDEYKFSLNYDPSAGMH